VKMRAEIKEVEEKSVNIAAFFDLDGTLVPLPSMERRFFWTLRSRRLIGIRNAWSWITETLRLASRGISQMQHANKMYLHGVRVDEQTSLTVPSLYPEAVERMAWHAERQHKIVIVSGTLEFLAERVARALVAELDACGSASEIQVCATRLELDGERWTGRIVGEAIFGGAKARVIQRMAEEQELDLERCYAYGDSTNDRWMLEAVGKPAAVNPSNDLARIARRNDWPVLWWSEEKDFTQRTQRAQRRRETPTRQQSDRRDDIDRGTRAMRVSTGHGA
jgi:HAD superfamily hydrolase (TIGR01490 family)